MARVLAVALGVVGCSARSPGTTTPPAIGLDDAIARFSDPAATAARAPRPRAQAPAQVVSAGAQAPRESQAPAARGRAALGASPGRVDVRLHDADLENALRMLADAAHVPIVVDGDVAGTVTIELRGVDPIRALAAIAAAHGARVERANGAIVVRAR